MPEQHANAGETANRFKSALRTGRALIGLWIATADPYVASIVGGAGFDWLVIDGEHGPNDVRSILAQLMALQASPSALVVRPPIGETWLIKQLLDIGAETLLVPMVNTREQAEALARAVRYPPLGERGMGAAIARASNFGRIGDYAARANDNVCLLVQAESRTAMANLAEIAAVDGVDGVLIRDGLALRPLDALLGLLRLRCLAPAQASGVTNRRMRVLISDGVRGRPGDLTLLRDSGLGRARGGAQPALTPSRSTGVMTGAELSMVSAASMRAAAMGP